MQTLSPHASGSVSPMGSTGGLAVPAAAGKISAMSVSQLSPATRSLEALSDGRRTTTYDLLYGRLMAWRDLLKMFAKYVHAVAQAKSATAGHHRKAAELLAIPTGSGDQFKQEGGILVAIVEFQKLSRSIAADEVNSSINMEASVVKELRRIKREVKARAKFIGSEGKANVEKLAHDEASLTEAIKLLSHALDQFVLRRADGPVPADPWLMNHEVRRKIDASITDQIATHNKMLAELDSYASLEASVMECLRTSIKSFSELWRADLTTQLDILATAQGLVSDLTGSTEYEDFAARQKGSLVQRKTEAEKEDRANLLNQVGYDNRDHALCTTVKTGRLMKKRALTGWKESYWVLTGSGWLHCFGTSDILRHHEPERSVFIGSAQLGPHSQEPDSTSFELVEQVHSALLGRRHRKHRFRGVTYAEALEWWKAIQPMVASVVDRVGSGESLDGSEESLQSPGSVKLAPGDRLGDPDVLPPAEGGGEGSAAAKEKRGEGQPPRIEVLDDTPPQVPPSPSKVAAEKQAPVVVLEGPPAIVELPVVAAKESAEQPPTLPA